MSDKELILIAIIIQLVLNVVFIFTLWKLEIKISNLELDKETIVDNKTEIDE
jgi:hypothetical protein